MSKIGCVPVRGACRGNLICRWVTLGLGSALLAVGLLACQNPAAGGGTGGSTPEYLYVTNYKSTGPNGISAYSIGSGGALTAITSGTFTTGVNPEGIEASANGDFLYVENSANGTVSAFTIGSSGSLSDVPGSSCGSSGTTNCADVPPDATDGAVSSGGDYLYVVSSNSSANYGVTPFTYNAANGTLTAGTEVTSVNQPEGVAVTPNGDFLYVANYSGNTVSGFSIGSGGALSNIGGSSSATTYSAGTGPVNIAISPNGFYLYVTNEGCTASSSGSCSAGLSAFTTYQGSENGELTPITGGTTVTGASPSGIAITPNGSYLYVANGGSNTISGYTIGSGGVLGSIGSYSTGSTPAGIAFTPDGKYLYVANAAGNTISEFSIGAGGVLTSAGTFSAGSDPGFIAIVSK